MDTEVIRKIIKDKLNKIESKVDNLIKQPNLIDLRDVHEWENRSISPLKVYFDEETRIKVLSGRLQDDFINNINKYNYLYYAGIYFKYSDRLLKKFPNRQIDINNAVMNFWQRVQIKLKELTKQYSHLQR